jgi:hypothetical protein
MASKGEEPGSMTTLEISGATLVVHVEGLDRLWAFKGELRVPLAHIAGVERAAEEARGWFHGVRAPGTHIPGVLTAGTFYENGGRVFWDVHEPDRAIAVRLHDESYAKLIVEVEDPEAAIAALEAALAGADASLTTS